MESLEEEVDRVAAETDFSGVVRVDRGDDVEFAKAYGMAHRGSRIPNTLDTQFAVASAVKGMTALAVVSLIVDGTLDLVDDGSRGAGHDLPLIDDAVTVEHLLAHRSGIGDYLDEDVEHDDRRLPRCRCPCTELATTEQYLAVLDGFPTKFPAGRAVLLLQRRLHGARPDRRASQRRRFHDLVQQRCASRPA